MQPPNPGSSTPPVTPPTTPPATASEPFWVIFECAGEPIWNHPLWTELTNTVPSLRIDCRYRYTSDGTMTYEPATKPSDTVYGFMTNLYRTLDAVGPLFGPRQRPFVWSGIPAGFGAYYPKAAGGEEFPNVTALMGNPKDFLSSGRRGPFVRRGIEANRAWTQDMLGQLAEELARRKLPDPLAFILTSENGPGDDYSGHLGNPDKGWVPEALADRRADDPNETVDGERTFRAYFDAARSLDGSPIPPFKPDAFGTPPGRSPDNHENSERYRGALRLLWDHSRDAGFSSVARRTFARDAAKPSKTVWVGEYGAACDSRTSPIDALPGVPLHQMDGRFRTEVQCPEWYGGVSWIQPDAITVHGRGWMTPTNLMRAFPPGESTQDPKARLRRSALELACHIATHHARAAPTRPLMPFVSRTDDLPIDDLVAYLRHCRSLGARGAVAFTPKVDRETQDYWVKVIRRVLA